MIPNARPIKYKVKIRPGENQQDAFGRFMVCGPLLVQAALAFGVMGCRVVDDKHDLEFVWGVT